MGPDTLVRAGRKHLSASGLREDTDAYALCSTIGDLVVTGPTRTNGLDPAEALARHDSHGFFQALGDSVVSGPTLTNVNDFRAILIA